MLAKHPDKCRFPHGHSRRVEVLLEAESLDANDMVCDFKAIKAFAAEAVEAWDHALCANTEDPRYADLKAAYGDRVIGFEGQDPTTEAMAKRLFNELSERMRAYAAAPRGAYAIPPGVRLARVRVWETADSWAEYGD